MKLKPLHDRIIVKLIDPVEKTQAGLYIPVKAQERSTQGKVLAVGPGTTENPMTVKVGDLVLIGKYAGTELTNMEERIILLKEQDVIAIIEEL